MPDKGNKQSAFAADEVAAAEANFKAAQERLRAARQRLRQSAGCSQGLIIQEENSKASYTEDMPSQTQNTVAAKSHVVAGILALFFGLLGIHKCYMGFITEGFVMLGATIIGSLLTFGAVAFIVQLIAVVEGLIYLIKTQNQFDLDYVYGNRRWL